MPFTNSFSKFNSLLANNPNTIKILAEGDSWLAYPRQFLFFGKSSNLVHHLGERDDVLIFCNSRFGNEVTAIMHGRQKQLLLKRIKSAPYDAIIFSGGGNDLGRSSFGELLKPMSNGNWWTCIEEEKLERRLSHIHSSYKELIEKTIALSINKEIKIITHTYDFPTPSKHGFKLFDFIPLTESWLYPHFKAFKITDPDDNKQIIKHMLQRFQKVLLHLQRTYNDIFIVVETQGVLQENQWRNEIHPTPEGFQILANMVYNKLIYTKKHGIKKPIY